MNKANMDGKDFLLTLLYCPGITNTTNEPIEGRTKLTKAVFLFEEEIEKDFFNSTMLLSPMFQFEPYNYGPYSQKLFDDLKFFLSIEFILTEYTSIPIYI
ncbi:MAG: hypothetical protein LBM77_08155 [Spirochaetaceae bacterium]|jgi:uncharacterized protein YwgA|nr:hypothetical protein [Spirochaetaceae bacterium]